MANIHSPTNSQCRARHRSTKPSRAMANRGGGCQGRHHLRQTNLDISGRVRSQYLSSIRPEEPGTRQLSDRGTWSGIPKG